MYNKFKGHTRDLLLNQTICRAIYHGSDVYMLDDVLSAVDAQVGSWILHEAILGCLMNQKTRVLCTHNIKVLSSSHYLFFI